MRTHRFSSHKLSVAIAMLALTFALSGCFMTGQEKQAEDAEAAASKAQDSAARAEDAAAKALDAAQKATVAADQATTAVQEATKALDRASDRLEQLRQFEERQKAARHTHHHHLAKAEKPASMESAAATPGAEASPAGA
ncbi:MAG: hypothetical protein WA740_17060, partial [Candidatus Binataceae bacterium]